MTDNKRLPGENTPALTRSLANEAVDRKARCRQILEILKGHEMTAKEIAVAMKIRGWIPTDERNFTAPRLTEMCEDGLVEPVGKRKCSHTGRVVTVYAVRE